MKILPACVALERCGGATGYMGKSIAFKDALADFSTTYADQNENDQASLLAGIRAGRIEVRTEKLRLI